MDTVEPTVFVVDDEAPIRDSLRWLIESVDLAVDTYASGTEFLDAYDQSRTGCLILDIRMPGMSGLDVQQQLQAQSIDLPVIFLTGHGDVHLAVRAMKAGAFDFVEKPYNDQTLLDLVQRAINRHIHERKAVSEFREIRGRWETLTPRERQIMAEVVDGHSNKNIASMLEITEKTIEFHRANVMDKMQASSLTELIRMAVALERAERESITGMPDTGSVH